MKRYCVNTRAQENGDHEVHVEGCEWYPDKHHQMDLGYFSNCKDAVKKARERYPTADGCFHCLKECHKQ